MTDSIIITGFLKCTVHYTVKDCL